MYWILHLVHCIMYTRLEEEQVMRMPYTFSCPLVDMRGGEWNAAWQCCKERRMLRLLEMT